MAWQVQGLSHAEKFVLIRLADRANVDGEAWPSHENIARDCCLSVRSIENILPRLEAKKLLVIHSICTRASREKPRFTYKLTLATPERRSPVTPERQVADTRTRHPNAAPHPYKRTISTNHQESSEPRQRWQIESDIASVARQILRHKKDTGHWTDQFGVKHANSESTPEAKRKIEELKVKKRDLESELDELP